MAVEKEFFGKTRDGREVSLYTLTNKRGMKAQVTDFGAILVRLYLPNKDGSYTDVVEGYDTLEPYFDNGSHFGATIGPNANRIGGAQYTLDGVTYQLPVNDGKNNLHTDFHNAFQKRVWDAAVGDHSVTFTVKKEDGDLGFPGNTVTSVTYTLTNDDELELSYHASSDKNTIINLTNHSYFNLSGHGSGTILDEKLWLNASHYTEIVRGAIPTGEIVPVKGTPLDFTVSKRIGDEIDADYPTLKYTGGYDQNWVIDDYDGTVHLIARVDDEAAGRSMEVYTDLPGVQFYAGNSTKAQKGKEGRRYGKRTGLCLETQYFPDTANHPQFPSCVFGPNREYNSVTIYRFIY